MANESEKMTFRPTGAARRRMLCRTVAALLLSASAHASATPTTNAAQAACAQALFDRWSAGLLALEMSGTGRPELDGNLTCPACASMHGRAADAVWPLVWAWNRTGESRYLEAAQRLVRWARHNCERPDGAYLNDVKSSWRGTTAFRQTALGKALLRFGDKLEAPVRAEWRGIFDRQTEWLHKWTEDPNFSVNVNYRAGVALSMEIAYALTGDARHRAVGDRQAQRVLDCIAADELLYGEAHPPMDAATARGCRGVDIGYNMEETLPAMLEWAELRGDEAALARLTACGEAHLAFVLPDGAIDNSFGSRAYKWSYWGSRTSDGALPLYAALARRGVRGAARAASLTLGIYERATDPVTGLLAGGMDGVAADEPTCLHHALCHLKTLPEFIERPTADEARGTLPTEQGLWLRKFTTVDVAVAGVGPWRLTASANDSVFGDFANLATGGGSLTLLHHREAGPVFAASMAKWKLTEAHNMQQQRHDDATRSFTPRLETADGRYANVYDRQVAFDAEERGGTIAMTARGSLRDADGKAPGDGGAFLIEWKASADAVTVSARCESPCSLVLPVLARPEDGISVAGGRIAVAKRGGTLSLEANRDFARQATQRGDNLAYTPQTGFLSAYLTLPVAPGETTQVLIRWARKE